MKFFHWRTIIYFLYFIVLIKTTLAYGAGVHSYITNESQFLGQEIPDEMKSYLTTPYTTPFVEGYQIGDDIIMGAGEEDVPSRQALGHFWQPDSPRSGRYNDGLDAPFEYESSYRRARNYWLKYVVPLYLSGDKDQAYYWLGRVAHFIGDATVPPHVLLDCHPHNLFYARFCSASNGGSFDDEGRDDSVLEEYTSNNFNNYLGENAGQPYNYQNLIPSFTDTDWNNVDSRFKDTKYLFRLMWYTAQKTQYFASDNKEQDFTYKETYNPTVKNWACSGATNNLWADQGFLSCSDFVTMNELRIDDARQNNSGGEKYAN